MKKRKHSRSNNHPASTPAPERGAAAARSLSRFAPAIFWAALVIFVLMLFGAVLPASQILFNTDANIGTVSFQKSTLPEGFLGFWTPHPLVGSVGARPISSIFVLMWLLPLRIFNNYIYAIELALASLFLLGFLRMRGTGWIACFLAVVTAFWTGTNLTLLYAGHLGKFGVLMFASLALYLIEKTVRTRRWEWAVPAGGALGMMLIEQQDVAVFVGLFLGAYAVFGIGMSQRWRPFPTLLRLVLIGAVALLTAGGTLVESYRANIKGAVQAGGGDNDPARKWEFCTQWSLPPAESIDLIAPGFTGWRSGERAGPYWGKTGRSAEWDKQKQGLPNLRLEGIYVGVAPLLLALFALAVALMSIFGRNAGGRSASSAAAASDPPSPRGFGVASKARDKDTAVCGLRSAVGWRADAMFWGVCLVVSLLLAFGKYFPLYSVIYRLPLVSSIRNPNKFLHVFQIVLAILAARGLDLAIGRRDEGAAEAVRNPALGIAIVGGLVGALLLASSGLVAITRAVQEQRFATAGWPLPETIVGNMSRALAHGGIVALLSAAALWFMAGVRQRRGAMAVVATAVLLAVVCAVDTKLFSRHYITTASYASVADGNAVTKLLKERAGDQRVAMVSQSGFYNQWLTQDFHFHGIPVFNIAQLSRMAEDYSRFLATLGRRPERLWQLGGVGYLLAPTEVWRQIASDPRMRSNFEVLLPFNVYPWKGGVGVEAARSVDMAQHVLLRYKAGLPKFSLLRAWRVVADKAAPASLADPGFNPLAETVVSAEQADGLPSPGEPGTAGLVKVERQNMRTITLRVRANEPGILLASQKYSPVWKAAVGGKPTPVMRCNYVCMGVFVDRGEHEVTFTCAPSSLSRGMQAAGLLVCVAAGLAIVLRRRQDRAISRAGG